MIEFKRCLGFQQITSLSAATALTVPSPDVTFATIQTESQAVRFRGDGSAPTASVGQRLTVGQELLWSADLRTLRFIEEASGAKLNVHYFA